jgi:hypothetical protein
MNSLTDLKEKLRKAGAKLRISTCLSPGQYPFVVKEAVEGYDEQRGYGYIQLRLVCGGKIVSDRIPGWKIDEFLLAMGPGIDDLPDFIGRSGQLVADPPKDGKIYYHYLPVELEEVAP